MSAKPDVRSRAQMSATGVLVDAVSWMTPFQPAERLTGCRTQSVVTFSSAVSAGLDCYDRPSAARPVLTTSPRTEASAPFDGK